MSTRKTDFFLSYKNFYMRLRDDFIKHRKLVIAYDFDDTISNFSKCKYSEAEGWDNSKVIKLLQDYRDYAYFILFTARGTEDKIKEAVDYIRENNIPLNAVNENMPGLPFGNSGKVYYNVLLDDKAGLGWPCRALRQLLKEIKGGNFDEKERVACN